MARPDEHGRFGAFPAWTFSPPPGADVAALVHAPDARAPASWGRVAGNRTTAYKFAAPRGAAVLLAGPGARCEVVLLDSGKGSVLYRRALPAPCGAKMALSENWLVIHFWDDDVREFGAPGWRLLSVELYEGGPDEAVRSPELSAYSAEQTRIRADEQAFVYAHDVSALAMSSTLHGITSKALIRACLPSTAACGR
jgi:hypothetical protein